MNKPLDTDGWSKRRFEWKENIHATRDLTRGAKLLATLLCDKYAGRNNGQCWPSNRRLAQSQGCDIRTIQRHLKDLRAAGWLREIPSARHKRLLALGFPTQSIPSHHDKSVAVTMTETTLQHDTTVTPYNKKEPIKKPNRIAINKSHRVVRIDLCQTSKITAWKDWISTNLQISWQNLEPLLRKRDQLNLPCQYPENDEIEREAYILFFERAIDTKGGCFS